MKSQVYSTLGELLYRCQRIEWQMKRFVDKGGVESDEGSDVIDASVKSSSIASIKKSFLDALYGEHMGGSAEQRERLRKSRSKSLDALISKRNYMSYFFAFEFDLATDDSCKRAMKRLQKIQKLVEKAENDLKADRENLQQSRKTLTQVLNPSEFMAILEERVVQFNSNREVAAFLSGLGFNEEEILAVVDILLSYEKGSWVVSSSFGQRLSKRIPGFKFPKGSVKSQGSLFELLEQKKYIELMSEMTGNQKFRVLFKV